MASLQPPTSVRAITLSACISVCISVCMMSIAACKSDTIQTVAPSTSSSMYWGLRNDTRAVTVAIGGKQQLSVIPVTQSGTPLTGLPVPTFTSSDPTKVTVNAAGVVTGVAETPGVTIVSSLQAQGVTYVDSTIVAVTPESAVLKAVSLNLPPGGTTLGLGDPAVFLFASAIDENDQPIPGAAISIVSLDADRLSLFAFGGPPMAQANVLGKTRVVVSSTSYGITKADTVEFTIQYGMSATMYASAMTPTSPIQFSPAAVLIGVGGTVSWFNTSNAPIGIRFDNDADQVVGGNISTIGSFEQAMRQFPVAGTYKFTEPNSGSTGTVIVREQPTF